MIKVRLAYEKDLKEVVNIHMNRFESFFLTSLGKSFLRVFYKAFLKMPGILLVLEDDGKIKGFVAGSINNKNFFKKLLINNLVEFILVGINILFTNPLALKRIASNTSKAQKNNIIFAELLSIATEKNTKGYGKTLLEAFESKIYLYNIGIPISLTTDFDNNEKVIKFYKDLGYEIFEIFESYQNRKMIRFIKFQTQ